MPSTERAVGAYYEDPASPGRVVQVKAVGDNDVTVETVRAADAAVSVSAVGKVTVVQLKTFKRFGFLGFDHCSFCGYTTHRQPDGSYHCPVTD